MIEEGQVNGEDVYCINTSKDFVIGCENSIDASNMNLIADVALTLEFVK